MVWRWQASVCATLALTALHAAESLAARPALDISARHSILANVRRGWSYPGFPRLGMGAVYRGPSEEAPTRDQTAVAGASLRPVDRPGRTKDDDSSQAKAACRVRDLLAKSENVHVSDGMARSVASGAVLRLQCKQGYFPRPGFLSTATAVCLRSGRWDGKLSCVRGCHNALLATASGTPSLVRGLTQAGGSMAVRCTLPRPGGATLAMAVCSDDGQWLTTEPCNVCSTSQLLEGELHRATLSVRGWLLPGSHVTLACPDGLDAAPTRSVQATCQAGGTWHVPEFDCRLSRLA